MTWFNLQNTETSYLFYPSKMIYLAYSINPIELKKALNPINPSALTTYGCTEKKEKFPTKNREYNFQLIRNKHSELMSILDSTITRRRTWLRPYLGKTIIKSNILQKEYFPDMHAGYLKWRTSRAKKMGGIWFWQERMHWLAHYYPTEILTGNWSSECSGVVQVVETMHWRNELYTPHGIFKPKKQSTMGKIQAIYNLQKYQPFAK